MENSPILKLAGLGHRIQELQTEQNCHLYLIMEFFKSALSWWNVSELSECLRGFLGTQWERMVTPMDNEWRRKGLNFLKAPCDCIHIRNGSKNAETWDSCTIRQLGVFDSCLLTLTDFETVAATKMHYRTLRTRKQIGVMHAGTTTVAHDQSIVKPTLHVRVCVSLGVVYQCFNPHRTTVNHV